MNLEYKGIQIHFEDVGTGECVLLLHGFLENCSMWKDIVPKLSSLYRVVTIDLLGHGKTGNLGYVHSMEMMADAVYEVLQHLKINRTTIIGHSMGGYVALALAESHPNIIGGLCLMNSTALPDSEERKLNRDRAIAAVKQNHKAFIGMSVANLFAPENREKFQSEIELVKNEALAMPLQGIIAALEGMKLRKDRTFILHTSNVKQMMIIGLKDPVLDYDTLIDQTRDTSVEVVEFSDGHMSYIENKKELLYNLMRFIEK